MRANFEWHTEEDNDSAWEPPSPPVPPTPRRRWPSLVLLLLLLLTAGILITRQLQQRIAAATAQAEEEVRAAERLVRQVSAERDEELFVTLISGREPTWTETQLELTRAGLLHERPTFALQLQTDGDEANLEATQTITLSADLRAAEVHTATPYTVTLPGRSPHTITLHHTSHYRQGEERWLYAPPPADFWGPWRVAQTDHLMISYTERDHDLIMRLLADLEALVTEWCAQPSPHGCPQRRFQWVRFDNNPDSLLSMAAPEATVRTGRFLNLPTPTLAGLPADEAAYEALLHGYARLVAARVIAEQTGWECCFSESEYPGILFYSALVDVQLARLGLGADPLQAAHTTLHSQPLLLIQLHDIWNLPQAQAFADPYNRAVAAATIAFMLQENPDLDVLEMQHDLARGPRFGPWYTTFLPDGLSNEATNRWLRFLGSGDSAALPSDILAFCERNLYQYEVLADSWKPLTNSRSPNVVGRLFQYPGPAGPLFQRLTLVPPGATPSDQTFLWRDGQLELLINNGSSGTRWVFLGNVSPAGHYLGLINVGSPAFRAAMIDMAECQEICTVQTTPGHPAWPPHPDDPVLYRDNGNFTLVAPGREEGRVVGPGNRAFWLDSENFVLVDAVGDVPRLVLGNIHEETGRTLLAPDGWIGLLPPGESLQGFNATLVAQEPGRPHHFFLSFAGVPNGGSYVFEITIDESLTTSNVRLHARLPAWVTDIEYDPTGRFLAVMTSDTTGGQSLYLYDLETGTAQRYNGRNDLTTYPGSATVKWHEDGWLLFTQLPGLLTALNPATGERTWLVQELNGCTDFAWVEE